MQVIAIASPNGGAGKPAIAIHLATAFSRCGKNSVLIDPDRRDPDLPIVIATHAARLEHQIARIASNRGDVVILDTSPHSGQISLAVRRNADLVLIPMRPSILDIDAISSTLELAGLQKGRR